MTKYRTDKLRKYRNDIIQKIQNLEVTQYRNDEINNNNRQNAKMTTKKTEMTK